MHTYKKKEPLMTLAYLANGQEIDAFELESGILRSNNYNCIYCGKYIRYVSKSKRTISHFRHNVDQSCITNTNNRAEIERRVRLVVENRRSVYRNWWYNAFDEQYKNKKINELDNNNRTTTIDIYIQHFTNYPNFLMENNQTMMNYNYNKMFMEFQAKPLSETTVLNKCEICNSHEDTVLLWFCDISAIQKRIKKYTTLINEYYEIRLFTQPQGLATVVEQSIKNSYEKTMVILDNGDYLYKIIQAEFDTGDFIKCWRINKQDFVDQLKNNNQINVDNERFTAPTTRIDEITQSNRFDYRSIFADIMHTHYTHIIDHILKNIDSKGMWYYANKCKVVNEFHSVVHFFVATFAIYTNYDNNIIQGIKLLMEKLKPEYVPKIKVNFGKYKGEYINQLPKGYIKWIIEQSHTVEAKINKEPYKAIYDSYEENIERAFKKPISYRKKQIIKDYWNIPT